MNTINQQLEIKRNQLNGRSATLNEINGLKQPLLPNPIPQWFLSMITEFSLIGVNFSLDEQYDESEMGVELKWLSPKQIIEESISTYPGINASKFGYLPIGACMLGSGDPYFLDLRNQNDEDAPIVRIPHESFQNSTHDEDSIEIVCLFLSNFFKFSSTY